MPEFPEIPLGRGKIFIPIGDGTEMMDTLYPIFRMREEGYEPVVSGPEARLYNGVMHEIPPGESVRWDITREQPSYHVRATIAFRDARRIFALRQALDGLGARFLCRKQACRYGLPRCGTCRGGRMPEKPHSHHCGQMRTRYHFIWRPLRR